MKGWQMWAVCALVVLALLCSLFGQVPMVGEQRTHGITGPRAPPVEAREEQEEVRQQWALRQGIPALTDTRTWPELRV